jgi:hypothetical protein
VLVSRAQYGSRMLRLLPATILVFAALACSSSTNKGEDRKPVYPVRGQVFFDKKPAAGAFLLFVPVNEPAEPKDPRPRAYVNAEGKFSLSTYDAEDGAPAGDYIVLVTWEGGTTPDGREEPPDKLHGRYSDPKQPKLNATVKPEANELSPFHLK